MEAASLMVSTGAAGLLLDPGLGKTSASLMACCVMLERELIDEMLVIAPLRPVYSTWPGEISKWHDFHHLDYAICHGKDFERNLLSGAKIKLMNPEGLAKLVSITLTPRPKRPDGSRPKPKKKIEVTPLGREYFNGRRVALNIDESTKFKKTNTGRMDRMAKILNHFVRRYIMTGSPIPNGLMDLFGQIYILDQGRALGAFITHYRNTFFNSTGFGGHTYIPHHDAEERIFERLDGMLIRKSAEEELDLPPIVTVDVEVDLPDKIFEQYTELEAELVAEIAGRQTIAKNAGHKVIACRQISNGGLYREQNFVITEAGFLAKEPRVWDELHDVKVQAVCDLVEELSGRGALVAYEFQHDLARLKKGLKKLLGVEPPHLGKGVTPQRGKIIEDEWNAGKHPVLLLHPDSAAHGLNLQGFGHAVIFASMIYNLEHYEQLIRRLRRQGVHEGVDQVVVHRILSRGTVDFDAAAAIDAKDDFQQTFLSNFKARCAKVEIDDEVQSKFKEKGQEVDALIIMVESSTGALLWKWDSMNPIILMGEPAKLSVVAESLKKDLVVVTQKRHFSTFNEKQLKRLYKELSGKVTRLRTFEELTGALWKFVNPSNADLEAAFPGQGGAIITQESEAPTKLPARSAPSAKATKPVGVSALFFSLFDEHSGKSGVRVRAKVLRAVRAAYPARAIPDAYFDIYLRRWAG